MAFGRRGYGLAAHNVIRSLRHHGYTGTVHLWITKELDPLVTDRDGVVFHHLRTNDPGWAKLELTEIITEPTLYLDVDSLVIGDITPLLMDLAADGREFITSVQGKGCPTAAAIGYFGWAKPSKVAEVEGFAPDATLYGIQSSWMFMRPGNMLTLIGDRARVSYVKWSHRDLRHRWGASKPDELFWGIACTDLGVDPSWHTEPMWFGSGLTSHAAIKERHTIITIPGNRENTSERARQIYDLEARKVGGHKSAYIFGDKHTNYKTQHDALRILRGEPAPEGARP